MTMVNAIPAKSTPNKRPMKNGNNNGVQYVFFCEVYWENDKLINLIIIGMSFPTVLVF
jgi:hypothetical protein